MAKIKRSEPQLVCSGSRIKFGLWEAMDYMEKKDNAIFIATNKEAKLIHGYPYKMVNKVNGYWVYVNPSKWDGNVAAAMRTIYQKCGYMESHLYQQVKAKLTYIRNDSSVDPIDPAWCDYVLGRDKSNIVIDKVIFDKPATIVYWKDGSKTVAICQEGDTFDEEKGLAICISKKVLGNNYAAGGRFKKALKNAIRRK